MAIQPAALVANGRVVTAAGDFVADVLVGADGRIAAIGRGLAAGPGVEVHDASGLLVLPGGVDVHTHLDSATPHAATVDDFASGTRAAAFGGTTTVVDYCTPAKGESLLAGLADWHRRRETACIDVGAHMIVLDAGAGTLAEMRTLVDREGVASFKFFMAYPGALMLEDGALFQALRRAGELGAMSCIHAENGPVIQSLVQAAVAAGRTAPREHAATRPALLEAEATQRAVHLAELARAPLYVVHLSAAPALDAVAQARARGRVAVHAETCPQYLLLDVAEYDRPGFEGAKFVMSPPLRDASHPPRLWQGLKAGEIDVVATDHCAFSYQAGPRGLRHSKQLGAGAGFHRIPNGAPGIEERLSLLHDAAVVRRGLSLQRFVDLVATAPARLFGLHPRKGTIAPGSDADLVLFDPAERWTVTAGRQHGQCDHTLYEGREVQGRVKKVLLRGRCIVDGDRWLGRAGEGQYLRRGATANDAARPVLAE